jgi:hypothetical protein
MNVREVRIRVQSCVYDYCNNLSWVGEDGKQVSVQSIVPKHQRHHDANTNEGFYIIMDDGSEFLVGVMKVT